MAGNSKKVILAALVGNSLIAVTKFGASIMTGSSAMFSEGIHSLVDTGNQMLLLYGLKKSARKPDENFPFGYGKEIYFWSFLVAILIFAVGSGISIYEGIHALKDPHEISNPMVNYIVLGLAMIFEAGALYFAVVEFNKTRGARSVLQAIRTGKDPTFFVVLFEDSAAMLGLVIAFIGVWLAQVTGNPLWDGIASISIGIILGLTALWLAIETKGLLIGEGAGPVLRKGIRDIVTQHEGVEKLNEILTLYMGPEFLLLNLSIEFRDDLDVVKLEALINKITREVKENYPFIKRVFIEAETLTVSINPAKKT